MAPDFLKITELIAVISVYCAVFCPILCWVIARAARGAQPAPLSVPRSLHSRSLELVVKP